MRFPYDLRFEHCYVPGKTGHGKTTLMLEMAIQDIENGAGITFIDPGGDAVKELIHHIPEYRKDDCIYIDFKNIIPFQFFNSDSPLEKDELVKDLTFLLLKGITNAARAENYIQRISYTLLDYTIPVCFLDAYYFLTKIPAPWGNGRSRYEEIMAASPEKWRARWQADFPKGDALSPILIRLEPLASNHITERLFGTLKPELNIAKAMNQRKIMLIDLGGAGRAKMEYGSLLFAKIKQEVFKRADIEDKAKRIPHFVFIDEFETFANPQDFSTVLKMARKYRLSLTLASLSRSELDSQLQNALGIISNYVMFSLNPEDLPYFRHFAPDVASDLPKYHAFYKIGENLEYKSSEKPRDIPETSFAKYIKDKTIADYAPNSQIRTVDNDALHTSTNPHTEGNGNKSEDIPPTGSRGDKTL